MTKFVSSQKIMSSINDCVMSSADSSSVRRSATNPGARDVDDDEDEKPDCPSAPKEDEDVARRVEIVVVPQNVPDDWESKNDKPKVVTYF